MLNEKMLEAGAFCGALLVIAEGTILMWSRIGLSSSIIDRDLWSLMFQSGYKFLWWPKILVGIVDIILFISAKLYYDSNSQSLLPAALFLVGGFAYMGFVVVQAVSTAPRS